MRTVISWRADGTQARSPCSLVVTWTARTSSWRPANREAGEDDGGGIYCLQCQGDFAQFHKLFRDGADVNCRGGEPLREAITNSHVIIWTQVTLIMIIIIITIIIMMMLVSCWTVPGWTWSSETRMGGQPCTWPAGTTRLVEERKMHQIPSRINTEVFFSLLLCNHIVNMQFSYIFVICILLFWIHINVSIQIISSFRFQ